MADYKEDKAADAQNTSFGYYELQTEMFNHFPVWKLSSSNATKYLKRNESGHWYIEDGDNYIVIRSKNISSSPFAEGLKWEYLDEVTVSFEDDDTLMVSRVKVFLGEHNTMKPLCIGQHCYTKRCPL